jgi:hypothetical protein
MLHTLAVSMESLFQDKEGNAITSLFAVSIYRTYAKLPLFISIKDRFLYYVFFYLTAVIFKSTPFKCVLNKKKNIQKRSMLINLNASRKRQDRKEVHAMLKPMRSSIAHVSSSFGRAHWFNIA